MAEEERNFLVYTMKLLQLLGMVSIIVLITNLLLFALGMIHWILFWGVIIVIALVAWQVIPRMHMY